MMHFKKVVAVAALGLGLSAFAQAAVYDLGTLNADTTLNANYIGVNGADPHKWFGDQFTFSINDVESASFGVVSLDLSFIAPNLDIKITSIWVNVYYNDGSLAAGGVLPDASDFFQMNASLGAPDALGKQTMQLTGNVDFAKYGYNGDFILRVSGETVGSGYGAYNLSLTGGPTAVVPEPAEYAMLLAGLGVVGMVARRRRLKV